MSMNNQPVKVMVSGASYLSCNVVCKWLDREEYGYKGFMELSAGISVLKISRINPDVLIMLLSAISWGDFNWIIDVFGKQGSNSRIILISDDFSAFDSERYDGIQKIKSDELNEKTLIEAVIRAGAGDSRNSDSLRRSLMVGDARQLKRIAGEIRTNKLIIFRFELEKRGDEETSFDSVMEKLFALHGYENNRFFCDLSGRYVLLVEIVDVEIFRQLKFIDETVTTFRKQINELFNIRVVVYISRIVNRNDVIEEYEKMRLLENYKFFLADRAVISSDLIRHEITGGDPNWSILEKRYVQLMESVVSGETNRAFGLLKSILLEDVLQTGNMEHYRLVMLQLTNILNCLNAVFGERPKASASVLDSEIHSLSDALALMREAFGEIINRLNKGTYSSIVIETLIEISKNRGNSIFLGSLARRAGVSESYLSRIFKRQIGMGISQCINHIKIYYAALELMRGDVKISDAAAINGFDDPKYFSKVFSRIMGLTPTEWKNRHSVFKGGI